MLTPGTGLKEIEDLLELTNMISGIENRETFRAEDRHVLGNKMRFSFDGKVKTARDRSVELSGNEKSLVLDACAHWMKKLGY